MYPIGKRGRKALVELWGLEFIHYFFGYCREHGYGMERNDADAVRTTEEDEGERMETDASTPLFGDFPPSVRRENLLYYPPTSEPF